MKRTGLQLLSACLIAATASLAVGASGALFAGINGLLCMSGSFVETHKEARTDVECSYMCGDRPLCQAFSTADGWCQLFVFDKCSKYVRDCNCTRRAQVFVRQQSGLPPGTLCPSGFGGGLCGAKYKAYSVVSNWDVGKAMIDAEPGLVIMADVSDSTEMNYLKNYFNQAVMPDVFLGGRKLPGSVEPAAGWLWVGCNTSVSSSLWRSGEPSGGTECVVMSGTNVVGLLNDGNVALTSGSGYALAECVSPFD